MTLFDRIKETAQKRGYSIAEVERKAGVSTNYMYQWKKRKPNPETLESVAKVLNVSVEYLLGKNDTPEWATEKDTHDLQKFLEQNEGSMTYGGEKLTEEDKEKLKIAMTQIFWRRHKHN